MLFEQKEIYMRTGAVEGLKIRGGGDLSGNMKNGKEFPHFYYVICRIWGDTPPCTPCSTAPDVIVVNLIQQKFFQCTYDLLYDVICYPMRVKGLAY